MNTLLRWTIATGVALSLVWAIWGDVNLIDLACVQAGCFLGYLSGSVK